jgi:putative ABC transport system substrate-binding protein
LCPRRRFLTGLGLLLTSPGLAHAQPTGNVPRVGYLSYGSPGPSGEIDAFRQGLREFGYIEGQSIAVEYRFASGQVERYPRLAAELVRMNVDVIVAPATPQALAAKQATSRIPIVFVLVADAVGAGLIANFARPGRNVTGLTSSSAELGGKRLGLLKEMVEGLAGGGPLQPDRSVQCADPEAAPGVRVEPRAHPATARGT